MVQRVVSTVKLLMSSRDWFLGGRAGSKNRFSSPPAVPRDLVQRLSCPSIYSPGLSVLYLTRIYCRLVDGARQK